MGDRRQNERRKGDRRQGDRRDGIAVIITILLGIIKVVQNSNINEDMDEELQVVDDDADIEDTDVSIDDEDTIIVDEDASDTEDGDIDEITDELLNEENVENNSGAELTDNTQVTE